MKNISTKHRDADPASIIQRWEKTGLLQSCHDPEGLALCLQTQVDFNEAHELSPQFRRISIPVVRRLFGLSEAMKRNHFLNYFEDIAWPQVLAFKTKVAPPKQPEGEHWSLQLEADWLAEASVKWAKELDEHFRDMRDREVIFRGLGHLDDGTLVMYYS